MSILFLPTRASAQARSDEAASAMPASYVDRLIDDGKLETVTGSSQHHSRDTSGNIRSLVVELGRSSIAPRSLIAGKESSGFNRKQHETGVSVSGRYRTVNFGELGIDAQLRRGTASNPLGGGTSRDALNGSMTLTSRELPLGNGWLATTALGTTAGPAIALVRRQSRFSLPAIPIFGAAATIDGYRSQTSGQATGDPLPWASFNFAVGEPGLLGGQRLSDYTGLSGRLISAGAQVEISSRWAAGIQAIDVSRTRDPYAALAQFESGKGSDAGISAWGAVAMLAYTGPGLRIQANAISTSRHDSSGSAEAIGGAGAARGGWIDASYQSGRATHSGGLYYFEPGLAWGTSDLVGNVCGAYYRFSASSQRWRWTFNLNTVRSIDGIGSRGTIANVDIQRKLDFRTTAGFAGAVRSANGQTTIQLLGYIDKSTRLGNLRADAGWSREPGSSLFRVGLNQAWSLPARLPSGSRLSTQVFFEQQRRSDDSSCLSGCRLKEKTGSFGAAISAGLMPLSGFSLDATLAYQSNASSASAHVYGPVDSFAGVLSTPSAQRGRAFTANIVANLRLSSHWSLSASYTDSTSSHYSDYSLPSRFSSPLGLTSTQAAQMRRNSFRLRAGYLTLRYALSAGQRRATVGKRAFPVGGSGNVEGRVYFDENDNRRREPSEAGASGIVVLLDGALAVRTDPSGYYRFDGVSDGPHRVTVNSDALPLPWTFQSEDERKTGAPYNTTINVGVRSTTTFDVPAVRER